MNFNEQWIRWEPIPELENKYYIDSLIDTIERFEILLVDTKTGYKKVRVVFEYGVDAYRCTGEQFRLKLIGRLNEKYGIDFYAKWTFFKVENSFYFEWLSEESDELSDPFFDGKALHFSFITDDYVLDVISFHEPKVEFIKD